MFSSMVQIRKVVCMAAALVQMQNELGQCDCLWRQSGSGLLTSGFAGLCWHGCNSSGLEMVPKFNTLRTHHPALRHFNNTQQKIKKHVGSPRRIYFFTACQASWSFVSWRKIYDCNVVWSGTHLITANLLMLVSHEIPARGVQRTFALKA